MAVKSLSSNGLLLILRLRCAAVMEQSVKLPSRNNCRYAVELTPPHERELLDWYLVNRSEAIGSTICRPTARGLQ